MKARTSVVTGGTGGLGTEVVRCLLQRGDRVWVPWVVEAEVERLDPALAEHPALALVGADVTDPAALEGLRERIEGESGQLDVLCNLVGGFTMASLDETPDGDWERMLSLNAGSAFKVTRAFAPLLRRSGRGRIVNVTAAPAVRHGGGGMAAYTASKGAVAALTTALARELADDGITVNAVAPTTIDTAANRRSMPDADRSGWVRPSEIGALMAFLTSDEARVLTGNVIVVGR